MKPDEMDEILAKAAQRAVSPEEEHAAIARAQAALLPGLTPVQPLAPVWVLTLGLLALFALAGVAAATGLGMHGWHVLSAGQRGLIFAALAGAGWVAAAGCARAMRPASGLRIGWFALILAGAGFPVLFSLIFQGYARDNFVHEGVPCLVAGLCVAIPTGLIIALILRRGFVMEWASAGVSAGALAGLAGLAMLELHCPNLRAIHVMFWHVAVVGVSGVLGWTFGWAADAWRRRRQHE